MRSVVCLAALLLHSASAVALKSAVFDRASKRWSIVDGDSGAASGYLMNRSDQTGWYDLRIRTNPAESNQSQAYGAGFLEGSLTAALIDASWVNSLNGTAFSPTSAFEQWVSEQQAWLAAQVASQPMSPYWIQAGLLLEQYNGMYAGYLASTRANPALTALEFLVLQLGPEVGDIYIALSLDATTLPMPMRLGSLASQRLALRKKLGAAAASSILPFQHCSSLTKFAADGELYTAHDTWSVYNSMLRVYKHIYVAASGTSVSFSSYPASLSSVDDWYVTSNNMAVMETTNDVFNTALYSAVVPRTVPEYMRVMIANKLATDGQTWTTLFAMYNSGTYNNQYIVVDFKKFTAGVAPVAGSGLLWIVEQIPGQCEAADVTHVLASQGYWPSYNIPFFPSIYNASGYPGALREHGDMFSYDNCARAKIFRRDQGTVVDKASMKRIMRYNKWQTDPLALRDACRGISARCDLNPPWANNTMNGYWPAFGAIDAKLTSSRDARRMAADVVAGPTWTAQPPFAWTEQYGGTVCELCPRVYAFEFAEQRGEMP